MALQLSKELFFAASLTSVCKTNKYVHNLSFRFPIKMAVYVFIKKIN